MLAIASANGLIATQRAVERMLQGATPLDACVEGVTLVEDDPHELSVGYGGLPNEAGVVELDAAVMDGRTHRGAGVAALRGVRHPSRVAKLLLEQTNRVLLVGEGALEFARANGFAEENLLTERARRMWLYWKRTRSLHDDWRPAPADALPPEDQAWFARHLPHLGGTVHCGALDDRGDLACVTSTSGHAFKLPGRVGDSPILGAGLYVDNEVGTCGSIGHGEANLENLSSFLAVELMRGGLSPEEAGLEVLRRVARNAHPDQREAGGLPRIHLQLFLLRKDGVHAGVCLRGEHHYALADANGARLLPCRRLYGE
jgi:N4-(beta-N-acetylglucosaminyl)-L-asparaginase